MSSSRSTKTTRTSTKRDPLDEELTDRDLLNIVSGRMTGWRPEKALYLGLDYSDVESIKNDYPYSESQKFEMLRKWKNMNGGRVTMRMLKEKLDGTGVCFQKNEGITVADNIM